MESNKRVVPLLKLGTLQAKRPLTKRPTYTRPISSFRLKARTARSSNENSQTKRKNIEILVKDHQKEIEEIRLKKVQAQAKKNRLKTILQNHKILQQKMQQAAIIIQKHFKGYITRLHCRDIFIYLSKLKIGSYLQSLDENINHILDSQKITMQKSAVQIQKWIRGKKARKILHSLKIEKKQQERMIKAAIKIQSIYRGNSARLQSFQLFKQEKLGMIRNNLKNLWFKEFWQEHKFAWKIIRHKYGIFTPPIICEIQQKQPIHSRISVIFQERILEPPKKEKFVFTYNFLKPTKAFLNKNIPEKKKKKRKIPIVELERNFLRDTQSRKLYFQQVQRPESAEPVNRVILRPKLRKQTPEPILKHRMYPYLLKIDSGIVNMLNQYNSLTHKFKSALAQTCIEYKEQQITC